MTAMRIQKYLSEQGLASRRKAEAWIAAGYVKVNGRLVTEPGSHFDPEQDTIEIDPKVKEEKKYYYLFNKPKGLVTVGAQADEREIKDVVRLPKDVVPVGRLDKDSGGLILLTNDGVVARRVMDPKFEHEKEYEVSFFQPISDLSLKKISQGLILFGKKTKPIEIIRIGGYKVRMILREGKNRQIRRMCELVGNPVKNLFRVRLLSFELGRMAPVKLRLLTPIELQRLYRDLNIRP
jgi:23S rRNA pseudouridine2605 synthase/23S rRNA pseudouridine2604 synthase